MWAPKGCSDTHARRASLLLSHCRSPSDWTVVVRAGGDDFSSIAPARFSYYVLPMTPPPVKRKRGRPTTGMDPVRTLRLPDELWQAVERLAKAQELSRSELIRVAVADYLKRKRAL